MALAGSGPVHIHAAEQTGEVEQCLAWSGARPVQWLLDHAPVDRRWCLVHATHMDDDGSVDGSPPAARWPDCVPITEANLGDGIFPRHDSSSRPVARSASARIRTCRSRVADELRQLEYSQRLRDRARNVIGAADARSTGRVLFEARCAAAHRRSA